MDGWGGGNERSMAWRGMKAAEEGRSGCGVDERGETGDVWDGVVKRGVCGWKGDCGGGTALAAWRGRWVDGGLWSKGSGAVVVGPARVPRGLPVRPKLKLGCW